MSVSSSIEQLAGLKRRVEITVSAEKVREVYNKHLSKVAKEAKIDGFRPGKTPVRVVEKRFGAHVRVDSVHELFELYFPAIVSENKLAVASRPEIDVADIKTFSPDQPLKISVSLEVYPEVTLPDLSGVKAERLVFELQEADIDSAIERLRKQHASWKSVDRVAETGDRVEIDFEGFLNGEPFEGNSAENFPLELGSGQMIDGFEDQLIGTRAGEEREINCTFPEDYRAKHLAGREASFKVKVKDVLASTLPEIDSAFAEKIGLSGGVEALREEISKGITNQVEEVLLQKTKSFVMEKLLELNPLEVPEALVRHEIEQLREASKQRAERMRQTLEAADLDSQHVADNARKRVQLGLLMREVVQKYQLAASPQAVRERVERMASVYRYPEQIVSWYYSNKDKIAEVEAAVLEDQAIEKLLETMQTEEKKVTYAEALHS